MFSHIRKQQQLRAKATNGPVKAKRQFGDYRMDYIKACVHDMKSKNPEQCPLCKLTSYAGMMILLYSFPACAFLTFEQFSSSATF